MILYFLRHGRAEQHADGPDPAPVLQRLRLGGLHAARPVPALPVQRTYKVTLRSGQAVDLARAGKTSSGKGSSLLPLGLGLVALLAVAVGGGAWFGRHRRAMVPAR